MIISATPHEPGMKEYLLGDIGRVHTHCMKTWITWSTNGLMKKRCSIRSASKLGLGTRKNEGRVLGDRCFEGGEFVEGWILVTIMA